MKNNIAGIKMGTTVNLSINGKLYKKNCGTPEEADLLFKAIIKAKEDPSDVNVKAIRIQLNEKLRVAYKAGLEHDLDSGEIFLAGFNTPIPMTLVEVIEEYFDNSYPLDAILNFWKLLMINPDKRVRTSLFDFIKTHDFVLTDKGYMVVYKAVNRKKNKAVDTTDADLFTEFVSNKWLHVKKEWKCSPNKYVVYKDADGTYGITKVETAEKWVNDNKKELLGNLGDLYLALVKTANEEVKEEDAMYTDKHTNTMNISLGVPVIMERKDCDSDPAVDCSYGLHCGATGYIENWYKNTDTPILACLVNPANVVAVPNYDKTKMRVTEYFPFAVATYADGKIDIIEQKYFETDYIQYEHDVLNEMVAKIKAEELPIETAIKAEKEDRPMSELLMMVQSRLVDID